MSFNVVVKRVVSAAEALSYSPTVATDIVAASGTGALLHLDASVGVTADVNGKVSVWADNSPQSNNFSQTISTNQPVLTTNTAGLSCIDFGYTLPSVLEGSKTSNSLGKTVVVVYDSTIMSLNSASVYDSHQLGTGRADGTTTTTQNINPWIGWDMGTGVATVNEYFYGAGGTQTTLTPNFVPESLNSTTLTCQRVDISSTTGLIEVYKSGAVLSGTYTTPAAAYGSTDPRSITYLGRNAGAVSDNQVRIYELAIYDKTLSASEMSGVVAYINSKYGSL